MQTFDYYNPVRVHFEAGGCQKLGQILKGQYRNILLVCAQGPFRENGVYDRVKAQCEQSGAQVVEMENDVESNPKLASVYEGVRIAVERGVDCVVALGGGSAMDCSKVIAASAKTGVDPYEYIWGSRLAVEDSLDTVMIPTIAATGTELNDTAVIVNERTKEKYWCVCKFPKYCLLDPELTLSLPKKLTVWGAMDILSHSFEYYFNGNMDSQFQLSLSEALISSTMSAVERLVEDPGDVNARGEILWCSTMTWGSGLTKIGRGEADMTCHSIEESFSGYFNTHHGACLGILTPRWMRFVCEKEPKIFARFARKVMGIQEEDETRAAVEGVEAYVRWLDKVGAPKTYDDLSDKVESTDEKLMIVADNAWRIYNGKIGRLYPMRKDEIIDILLQGKEPLD